MSKRRYLSGLRRVFDRLLTKATLFLDPWLPVKRRPGQTLVAGMATTPSRLRTFRRSFRSIIRQVDRIYLYLDGHAEVPKWITDNPKVVPILSRDEPGLHANGKLLGLRLEQQSCIYLTVDDDIYYSRRYANVMQSALEACDGPAVICLHGSILARPFRRYLEGREIIHFRRGIPEAIRVDVIGTGTSAFRTGDLHFDVRSWGFTNMVDLGLSLEAGTRSLPLLSVARPARTAIALGDDQPDSIFEALKRDDSRHTAMARNLPTIGDQVIGA